MNQNTVLQIMDEIILRAGPDADIVAEEPTPLICAVAEELYLRGQQYAATETRTELQVFRNMLTRAGILAGLFPRAGGMWSVILEIKPGTGVALMFDDKERLTTIEARRTAF